MNARLEVQVLRLDDGRELAFAEYGDPGGAAVFAFHGTPGSHRQLEPVDTAARAAGARVVAPDRPGYGHSTFAPDRALTDWPGDVLTIADHLGVERFAVIGISGGGPHAAVCAHALGDRVTRCVLASGVGPIAEPADCVGMMATSRMLSALARRSVSLARVPFGAMALAGRHLSEERLLDLMAGQLPESDAEVMRRPEVRDAMFGDMTVKHPTMTRAAAQDFALFARPWGFELGAITVPVDVWHGDLDVNVPLAHGHRYVAEIPDATLHQLDGQGHLLVVDAAEEILRVAIG